MIKPKLIVVDDEPDFARFVSDVAEQAGYDAELFYDAETFKLAYHGDVDVIILDLLMPGVDGVEVIRYLGQFGCDAHLILISGFDPVVLHSAQRLAIEHNLNFVGSLGKPFRRQELYQLLGKLSITPKPTGFVSTQKSLTANELHTALRDGELVVHYQPKIQLQTGNVAGLEALVRWQHPKYGLVSPDLFVPLAEQHNLIDDLTWFVLRQVTMQCRDWKAAGQNISVAVNMSASTLRELTLPERLHDLVREHGIEPKHLMIEVTETELMRELVKFLDILTRLRMKGFNLAIDDFGTGYSSLVQLHRAPFAEIKIDRSFVLDMANDKEANVIVETVIVLAHKLGMKVVAEGVETQTNLDKLTAMGCDMAQGYHIGRPQSGTAISDWLLQHSVRARLG